MLADSDNGPAWPRADRRQKRELQQRTGSGTSADVYARSPNLGRRIAACVRKHHPRCSGEKNRHCAWRSCRVPESRTSSRVRTVGRLASFRKCAADVSSLLAGKTERRGGGVFDQGHTAHGTTNDGPADHHREPTAGKIAAGDVERSGHQPTRPCGESATLRAPQWKTDGAMLVSQLHDRRTKSRLGVRTPGQSSSSRQPRSSVGPGGLWKAFCMIIPAGQRSCVQAPAGGVLKARRYRLSMHAFRVRNQCMHPATEVSFLTYTD